MLEAILGMDVHLRKGLLEVRLDGVLGDEQPPGDISSRVSVERRAQDSAFVIDWGRSQTIPSLLYDPNTTMSCLDGDVSLRTGVGCSIELDTSVGETERRTFRCASVTT